MLQLLSICLSSPNGVRVSASQTGYNKKSWTALQRCTKRTIFTSLICWLSCTKPIRSDFHTRLESRKSKTTLQRPALDKHPIKSCKCWLTSSWVLYSRTSSQLCTHSPTEVLKRTKLVWVNSRKILHSPVSWSRVPTKKPNRKLKDSSDTSNRSTQ